MHRSDNPSSDRQVTINTIWNFAGLALPLLAAVVAFPGLIARIGNERFGLLALAWVLLGYLGLFDLGVPRALTKMVAEGAGRNDANDIEESIWSAIWALILFGSIAAVIMAGVIPFAVQLLNVKADLRHEALIGGVMLAATLPLALVSAGLRGVLEGKQRFLSVALIRGPSGALTCLGPLAAAYFAPTLPSVIAGLIGARVFMLLLTLGCCIQAVPGLKVVRPCSLAKASRLTSFGAWLTISGMLNQGLSYADRFVIGAVGTAAQVAYYVTPFELVTRLWMVSTALGGVLFPNFASRTTVSETMRVYWKGMVGLTLLIGPVSACFFVFAQPILRIWIGAEFAAQSAQVMRILAVGVLFSCVASIPATLLQSVGYHRLTVFLTACEAVPYLVGLPWIVRHYGILGAAMAWSARVLLDLILMMSAVGMVKIGKRECPEPGVVGASSGEPLSAS